MSRTIVQEYGPIYGEPVNGTVQGRPNGSVFVPLVNRIICSATDDYIARWTHSGTGVVYYTISNSSGVNAGNTYNVSAEAQDLASNVTVELYSDLALTQLVAKHDFTAGIFNISAVSLESVDTTPQAGDTLYLIARLMNNGTPVAVSTAIPLELVVI